MGGRLAQGRCAAAFGLFGKLKTMDMQKDLQLYRQRKSRVSWKVPAFCCNDWAAVRLLQICDDLAADKPFDIVYGAPKSVWSGGRPAAISQTMGEEQLARYFKAYGEFGVTCALTLSRLQVPSWSYKDPYGNLLLDMIEQYEGEAIVFDDGLARYIRNTHPGIKIIASLNKAMCDYKYDFAGHESETSYYRSLLELYDEVVIRCEYAADDELLENLADVADRVEIIANQFCIPNCKNVYKHLNAIEEWERGERPGQCQQCFSLAWLSKMENRLVDNLFMSDERISELSSRGFKRIKLAGRNFPMPKFLDMLSRYIFEPTGAISIINNEILRDFRMQASVFGPSIQQFKIPENRAEAVRLQAR